MTLKSTNRHLHTAFFAGLLLTTTISLAQSDDSPPPMYVARIAAEPNIDGKLDDPCWRKATLLTPFHRHGSTQGPTQQTRVRVGWGTNAIFFAFRCDEEQPDKLRANLLKLDEGTWLDDSVNLILDVEGKRVSSFEFIVSASNSRYDGRVRQDGPAIAKDASWNGAWESAVSRGDKSWSVEIKIPYATLGVNTPTATTTWALNAARHRTPVMGELSSWSYIRNTTTGFADFASLVDTSFIMAEQGETFAGIPAPTRVASTSNENEPTLIPPISKKIKPDEASGIAVRKPAQRSEVPIIISAPSGLKVLKTWPVRCGVPFPRGSLPNADNIRLLDSTNQPVPVQTKVLGTWDEGKSVRWLLLSFNADLARQYKLVFGTSVQPMMIKPVNPVVVSDSNNDYIEVSTGALKVHISKRYHTVIDQVWWQGHPLLGTSGHHGAWLSNQDGHVFEAARDEADYKVQVEQAGPLRAVIKASSWFCDAEGKRLNQSISRIHINAGSPVIQVQHTFVLTEGTKQQQYKNISFSLPIAPDARNSTRAVAQSVGYNDFRDGWRKTLEIKNDTFSVSQLSNRGAKVLDGAEEATTQNECAGGWADMSGKNAGIGLAARWFSQNYPNELELNSNGELTYHFWSPRFNYLMDLRPKPWLTARGTYEAWRKIIVEEVGKKEKRWHEVPVEEGGTFDPDGFGVAKTHEFALIAHSGGAGTAEFRERAGDLEEAVYAWADPKWMASAEVFQRTLPAGDPRFAEEDIFIENVMRRLAADQRDDKYNLYGPFGASMGIFDFGDDIHQRKYPHRFYAHFFYCSPTLPWSQFLRSGSRGTREQAEANSRHRMDVDMCHYTADEDSHKRMGAWNNDDDGNIHWGTYMATQHTTSNYGPHLAYMYYLTGDERAYDVALEVTDALKWSAKKDGLGPFNHRATGMTMWNIVELWQLTGDLELKKYADFYTELHAKAVREGLALGYSGADVAADFTLSYVTPGMIHYHMLTGDPQVGKWIVDQAAYLAQIQRSYSNGDLTHWDLLSYAYQLTGDARYLQPAVIDLRDRLMEIRTIGTDDYWLTHAHINARVWAPYHTPMLVAAIAAAGKAIEPQLRANDLLTTGDIAILNEYKAPLEIDLCVLSSFVEDADLKKIVATGDFAVVLKNPAGEIVDRAPYPGGKDVDPWLSNGPWRPKLLDTRNPQAGVYRVQLQTGATNPGILIKPLACTSSKVMSRVPDHDRAGLGLRYFTFVPKGTKKFGFRMRQPGGTDMGDPPISARIYAPDGKVAASVDFRAQRDKWSHDLPANTPRQWLDLVVDVPAGMDGHVWQIEPPPFVPERRIAMIGVAPYLAATAQSCFEMPAQP